MRLKSRCQTNTPKTPLGKKLKEEVYVKSKEEVSKDMRILLNRYRNEDERKG